MHDGDARMTQPTDTEHDADDDADDGNGTQKGPRDTEHDEEDRNGTEKQPRDTKHDADMGRRTPSARGNGTQEPRDHMGRRTSSARKEMTRRNLEMQERHRPSAAECGGRRWQQDPRDAGITWADGHRAREEEKWHAGTSRCKNDRGQAQRDVVERGGIQIGKQILEMQGSHGPKDTNRDVERNGTQEPRHARMTRAKRNGMWWKEVANRSSRCRDHMGPRTRKEWHTAMRRKENGTQKPPRDAAMTRANSCGK
jgi:hypothetical protein